MGNLETDGGEFPTDVLEQFRRRVRHARAMIRSVMIAINAKEDGSVNFDSMDDDAHRWHPVTAAVLDEMIVVRDMFINAPHDAPVADWMKPLAQIEALDAALWYGGCTRSGDRLENIEIFDAAEAIVGSLDELLEQTFSSAILRVDQVAAAVAH